MFRVITKKSTYLVDRDNNRWMRLSDFDLHRMDGEWVKGGFTLGGVEGHCFAHFEDDPLGATGRWTSSVVEILDPDNETGTKR